VEIPREEIPQPPGAGAAAGPAASENTPSIVVLPFENLSPDPSNAYFADGLTEEIIADLSRVRGLRVISRTSAMVFKGTAKTLPAIGMELGVRYALEGSVRREGGSLRITAQLIDSVTDAHLWAEKYSGTLGDVFHLQEQLSRRIVDALAVTLSPEEDRRLAARPIQNVQAYDIWLRARQQALTMSLEGLERARELVEQALTMAGPNALLHATLGWVHAVRFAQIVEGADEALSLARRHAARALELDPGLPWARFSQAIVHLREADLQGFVRWGKRVLEIVQDRHTLAVLSLYLAEAGRIDAARRYAAEAASLDPLSFLTTHAGPHVEVHAGNAAEGFTRMRDLAEKLAPGEAWPAFEVGYAAFQAGLDGDALAWLRRSAEGGSPYYSGSSRLLIHLLQDEPSQAEEVLRSTAFTSVAGRIGPGSHLIGGCLAGLGKTEEAFEWLEQGVRQGFTNHRFLGEYDRLLAPLRGTPPFQALLAKAREKEAALAV
jgi:TolB-like protein